MKSGETMLRKIGCAAAVAAMVAVAGCSDSIDVGEGRLFPSTASCSADETRQGDECVPAVHPCTALHRVVLADGSCGGCRDGFAPLNDQCVESVPPAGGSVEPTEPGLPGSHDGAVPETEPQPGMAGGDGEGPDAAPVEGETTSPAEEASPSPVAGGAAGNGGTDTQPQENSFAFTAGPSAPKSSQTGMAKSSPCG